MSTPPFDLDDVTNLVQHHGISARLSEQEKRLLVRLAARPGKVFDKPALMEALWGQRAQWMEDAALVQLVSRLRRSLAPLGLHRAIVTVARVGYRFDMPVASLAFATSATSATSAASAACDSRQAEPDKPDEPGDADVMTPATPPYPHVDAGTAALSIGDATAHTSPASALLHGVARDGHGEVRRQGVTVRIPQIEYRLLCALRSPPDVAHDKRTLIATLWPERPDQDDTNLMQVVSRLRRRLIPLGLHGHIVTVPRIGYRFEPWHEPGNASSTRTAGTPSDTSPPASGRGRTGFAAALLNALHRLGHLTCLTRRLRWRRR
ncbi:hypothetical protein UC34_10210 [Pandoraea vervacti]|uniref:OmpR/PhoB-type domain-containing protein n=1 Tax=Pandoraea vervacti TaxID=656178 RepID=A0ABN4FNQ3_9BURK|nr:helix-turn-helix domain-containing protein [Pandoraea vervacti]AJP57278.1 hypothetical protein UC34_10210 [Pandoraea vervacti]